MGRRKRCALCSTSIGLQIWRQNARRAPGGGANCSIFIQCRCNAGRMAKLRLWPRSEPIAVIGEAKHSWPRIYANNANKTGHQEVPSVVRSEASVLWCCPSGHGDHRLTAVELHGILD